MDKPCARCGTRDTYVSDRERCVGCGCFVPLCYTPMRGMYIATVADVKARDDPPSVADILERWADVTFCGGDRSLYDKHVRGILERGAIRLRA